MSDPVFTFQPRWKEELLCSCSEGSFVLEMPMGIVSVYLPSQDQWPVKAPSWTKGYWTALQTQLSQWCVENDLPLYIEDSAHVW
jgi:elongation factor P hydroxylase